MPVTVPPFVPEPFASDAADPAYRVDIPAADPADGHASYALGFPPLTMTAVISGGIPPFGQDVNGILYALSWHAQFVQAGQYQLFRSDVSGAIGGYEMGSVVRNGSGTGLWFNTVADNTTPPTTAGSGWMPLFSAVPSFVAGLTGGTVTLTQQQAFNALIRLTGTLTSNLQIIVPDWDYKAYRISNACTGAYTVTVKTALGTGIAIPAGGITSTTRVFVTGTGGSWNVYAG